MTVSPWRRILTAWLTICMVSSLVPVTPGMAEDFVGQGGSDDVVEGVIDTPENDEVEPDNVEPTEVEPTNVEPVEGASSNDEEFDAVSRGIKTTNTVADSPKTVDLAEGEVLGTADDHWGNSENDRWDGYFTTGVTGQTSEGTTPKVYYQYTPPVVFDDGMHTDQPAEIKIVNAEEGITSITIPTYVNVDGVTATVLEIYDGAFYQSRQTLSSVDFHTNSALETFAGIQYSQITSIVLPTTVRTIGWRAFSHCSGLTSITLPDDVTSIGQEAFRATGLTSIELPGRVGQIDDLAFAECQNLTFVALPNSLTAIYYEAFMDDVALEEIQIPAWVSTIGAGAFMGCTALTTINLPNNDNFRSLEGNVFKGCTSLTSIEIPDSVHLIGESAFEGCAKLETVKLPNHPGFESLPESLFKDCTSLQMSVFSTMPESVTAIYRDAFQGCTSLTGELVIPDSVVNLGESAFAGCTGITSVKLPSNLAVFQRHYDSEEDWICSAKVFKGCTSLASVTWPTADSFDTIPSGFFEGCTSLASPVVVTSIPSTVTTIRDNAFKGCGFTSVDVPDSVNVIKYGAFDCPGLQSFEWPQDNGAFDTFYGGFGSVSADLADSLIANLPASVKTIAEGACKEQTNITSVDLSTTSVESIGDSAFEGCTNVTSITLPNTLVSIGDRAFSSLGAKASGIDIVVPASTTTIGGSVFDNSWDVSDYRSFHCHPSTIHIMNPDLVFSSTTYSHDNTFYIDGTQYICPFNLGQTIYASAVNSQGEESFIHQWSQREVQLYWDSNLNGFVTSKIEDLGDHLKDENGVGAYTFVWTEPGNEQPVTVSGTVPAGATLTMTQGTGSSKVTTNVTVSPTGTFSTDAQMGKSTILRVSLAGYYDYTLARSASAMNADWNDVMVTTDQMNKIPTKNYMILNLKRLVATSENGTATYANMAGDDNLEYRLVDADGRDVAFTTEGTILTITANNDDNPANDIAADAPLTLTATPTERVGKAYQIGPTTATATLTDGRFDAVLPAWGTAAFTVNSASASYDSDMRVMVFKGNNLVESGTCMTGLTYVTKRLEAGSYTVVALNNSITFKTSTLKGISSLGLDDFVVRQEFQVADGTQANLTLSVPLLDLNLLMTNAGLKKAGMSLMSKSIVVGGEQTAIIDYTLDIEKTTGAELRVMLPAGTYVTSCGCSEGNRALDYHYMDDGDSNTATYAITLADASQGKVYVKYRATAASIGTATVGLSAYISGVSVPVTSNTYTVDTFGMNPMEEVLTSTSGSVELFAAPTELITLTVTSDAAETTTKTLTTGMSCHKTVSYDLPGTPLTGQSYTLKASIGTKGTEGYREETKQVKYSIGTKVVSLSVTNGDQTSYLVKDYKARNDGLTVLYHLKDKKYAYWGFKMMLAVAADHALEDSFMLYVETLGGRFEQILMKKTYAGTYDVNGVDTTFVTYTGTYTDEVWLEAYQRAVENDENGVWTFDWNEVFVPETISYPSGTLTSLVQMSEEDVEKLAQRSFEEWQRAEKEWEQALLDEATEALGEDGDVRKQIEDCNASFNAIAKAYNDMLRQAAAETGEPLDESDLLPEDDDFMKYFIEEGNNGVTINDILFDDRFADPYSCPVEEEPKRGANQSAVLRSSFGSNGGDDEGKPGSSIFDWYAFLFGSDGFVDKYTGASVLLSEEQKQILASMKDLYDRALADANSCESELCALLGVEGGDLSQYSSWNDLLNDKLSSLGMQINALREEGAFEQVDVQPNSNFVTLYKDSSGFEATDNKNIQMNVSYEQEPDQSAWSWRSIWDGINDQGANISTTLFTLHDGLMDLTTPSFMGIRKLIFSNPTAREAFQNWYYSLQANSVRGVTLFSCMGMLTSTGLSSLGIYATEKKRIDTNAECEYLLTELHSIDSLIAYWESKNYEDCENKFTCIEALQKERNACVHLYNQLVPLANNYGWDGVYNTVFTSIGVAAFAASALGTVGSGGSLAPLGAAAMDASIAVMVAAPVYSIGSSYERSDLEKKIDNARKNYRGMRSNRMKVCTGCKSNKPPETTDDNDDDTNKHKLQLYLDPSGVVYEAVLSNRVEGATVTVWRSDSADGSNKVADDTFVATGQANPQTTGSDGIFQWDVTSGYYQVVVDDGDTYTGASSEWLPVTPPQFNVNLGVVSTQAPAVSSVAAYTDYVEVIFSQWMQTGDVQVTGIDGATCEWVNTEQSGDPNDGDVVYSRVLHIRKPDGFTAGSTVAFGIAADGVTSYNGKSLADAYDSGELTVTQRPANILLNIEGDEEGTATELKEQVDDTDDIDAYVMDASGKPLSNQRVTVVCGSDSLATITSLADASSTMVVTDEDGKASFNLVTQLPGMTELTFSVDGTSLSRTIDLLVEGVQVRPNRPTATITDGTNVTTIDATSPKSDTIKVTAGATLTLAADEGDEIYYTTNDTCPCNDGSRTKYTGPITLKENTYYRIAAYNGAYDPSEGGYSAYSRRLNLTIEVTPAPATQIDVPKATNRTYNGKAQVGVKTGTGYTLSGTAKATNAGTYSATATLADGYVWADGTTEAKKITWKITAASLAKATVSSIASQTYTGKAIKPKPTVTLDGRTLVEGTDYTLSYANNVNVGTATVTVAGKGNYAGTKSATFKIASPSTPAAHVAYRTHVQNVGWQGWRRNGAMSGTSGRALRLEGIELKLEGAPLSGGIEYRTHVQNVGWQGYRANGAMSGTSGRALRLEAIQIRLTGQMAKKYDVWYRVHAQNVGWMGWARNDSPAGTAGYSYRLEGIEVRVLPKGSAAPGQAYGAFASRDGSSPAQSASGHVVASRTHVQDIGWQPFVYDGQTSGTQGLGKRLEGIEIKLAGAPLSGGIEYRTHVQNVGWQGYRANGAMSGTSGRGLRLEAIQVRLTGQMAKKYDVWYRVHAQNFGWMGWARNDQQAGTAGYAYRLEGIQLLVLPKGSVTPGPTANAFRQR